MESSTKFFSSLLFLYLIGSTLCVIPEGEYQFGPVFGNGRFFGHKYFEAFVDKGQIKPLLAKKALLGVAGIGAVAAAGGAVLLAKKIHENKGFGHGNNGGWYPPTQSYSSGWYPSSSNGYSQDGYSNGNVNFPSAEYQHQNPEYQYPAVSQGYANGEYADNYNSNGYYGNGWSR